MNSISNYTKSHSGVENKYLKNQDLKLGKEGEKKALPLFRNVWGNVFGYKWGYSPIDFYAQSPDTKEMVGDKREDLHTQEIELKTRRYSFGRFPDYCFGENKIEKARRLLKEHNLQTTFVFNLTDGFFYWNFDENTNECEYRLGMIANMRRNGKAHSALFIYKEYLTPFSKETWKKDKNLEDDYHNHQRGWDALPELFTDTEEDD